MSGKDYLGEELLYNLLKESADNFFGRRVRVEKDIEFLKEKIEELKKRKNRIENLKKILAWLLVTPDNWKKFWELLKVDISYPENLDFNNFNSCKISIFFWWRYKNIFLRYYNILHKEIEYYLYGEEIYDSKNKMKKITFNYNLLFKLIEEINRKIKDINTFYTPTKFLQFSKKMTMNVDNSDITGSMFVYNIDDNFKIKSLELEKMGIPAYQEIPFGKNTEKKIFNFLKKIYKRNKKEIKNRLKNIC